MIRIQRNTPAVLSRTFYEDGAAVNPGTVTISITASDGTAIATSAATTGTGTGARTYSVVSTDTALLDSWAVSWESTLKGTLDDVCEVVGGFLFSLTELGAVKLGQSGTIASTYTTQQMLDARILAETSLEDACNVAFVQRYKRETLSGEGGRTVMLTQPNVTAVRSVTIGGVSVSGVTLAPSGVLYRAGGWPCGFQNVVVGFEHGMSSCPPRVSQAAKLLARRWLVDGPVDDRATSVSMEGVGVYSLATPGMRGSTFGMPEVDAVVQRYDMNVLVA